MRYRIFVLTLLSVSWFSETMAQTLTVDIDNPKSIIQPTMWGIFFEDINFGADGGMYAELVKNRSFEFDEPMMGWSEQKTDKFSLNTESGSLLIVNRGDNAMNTRFARVSVRGKNNYGITNEGFRGIGITKDSQYEFSILAAQKPGNDVSVRIELIDAKGTVIGSAKINPSGSDWKKYTVRISSSQTEMKAKLNVWFDGTGTLDLDMISLFPVDTWKQRPGGLRKDLIQLLADLKPGFMRFPGGCIVEGRDLLQRYQWKKTVGKVEERDVLINRWNTEFSHRPAPDYFQSFGLGFFEYFQLAEDIGAAPLPILSCGMACQFNTAEVVPIEQIDPYVQDALDLIEFANGDESSSWGKLRTQMGHQKPFNLKFIGVGNEQWGPQYIERYKVFAKAIKSKYPEMTIVSGAGPFPDGELFDFAQQELKSLNAEIIDEHYYRNPEWFLQNANRYDKYDRNGPKIFAGEYAAQSVAIASPDNKNNWLCALSEAAFMTGLERNADVVYLSSYAPLFAHAEGWQWTPDLIWFDNLRSYGTPNYYVQKLFSINKGTHLLSASINNEAVAGKNNLYSSAVLDQNTKEVIVKIVNASDKVVHQQIQLTGSRKILVDALLTVLKSEELNGMNSLEDPSKIKPADRTIKSKGKKLTVDLAPYSLSVVKFKIQ
jgi:alpha-N-arabinofuranosidase